MLLRSSTAIYLKSTKVVTLMTQQKGELPNIVDERQRDGCGFTYTGNRIPNLVTINSQSVLED